ncbi:hypothetical protein C1A40_12090 [Tamlana carrageenivorans]|uniref:Uncharacterized protein n=1 Tax=Pseudotamlana carrageenivorans TaxID=2069432 RepID=A0A2I7SJW3_9FLAO|nr:hypothetical protein C1A40_12090 [Tamlana carrageenivorans]
MKTLRQAQSDKLGPRFSSKLIINNKYSIFFGFMLNTYDMVLSTVFERSREVKLQGYKVTALKRWCHSEGGTTEESLAQ